MPIDYYGTKMSAPCRSVLMTARHLNIQLNHKALDLSTGEHLKPEFLKLNPAHTIPTIVDNGFSLWESRAIIQYLCNQYAPDNSLYPKDAKQRALVDRCLNIDFNLASQQRLAMYPKLVGAPVDEDKATAYKNTLKTIDSVIGSNKYFAGNTLTIADLSLLSTSVAHEWADYDLSDVPNYKRWSTQLKAELPYYKDINDIPKAERDAMFEKYRARLAAQQK